MSKKTIFNNKYIGWILFIMVIAGYSAYWVDNNRDFNTVIFDENNQVRDIEYIAKEYHKLFKDTDWENMPEFEPLSDEEQSLLGGQNISKLASKFTNINNTFEFFTALNQDNNTVTLGSSINFSIDSTNSIEDMVTNLKAGFEILEKAYPKDKKSLDKLYTEIPIHFTKYTNQENYQKKEYQQKSTNILEKENMDVNYIYIYIYQEEYYFIAIVKAIYK